MKENTAVSIVLPAFNEDRVIGSVLESLLKLKKEGWEIIVVDDGSTDATFEVASSFTDIKVIRHTVNKGYGAALKTGIKNSRAEHIIIMDADGQHNPEYIKELLANIEGYDMVATYRTPLIHSNLWRMPGKWLIGALANYLSRAKIPDLNSGFRAFKRETVLQYLHLCPNGFSFSTTITLTLLCEGYDVKFIPIKAQRRVGKSAVSVKTGFQTILLIFRLITLFNPLRIFLPISLILALWGSVLLAQDILTRNLNDSTILLILASILIFLFGLMTDQMSHIRRELR
jgi:glycosyltransferase involved in cell wall biosynthesis